MELNELEHTVLKMLLAGDDPVLATLCSQVDVATITDREYTGVGFFTKFTVPDSAPRVSAPRFVMNDVFGTFTGKDIEAGFLLFVRNGVLRMLEGFAYDHEWPADAHLTEVYYIHHEPPGSASLRRCAVRDMEQLRPRWSR